MKMYAFWNYDSFPYLLGDEITDTKGNYVRAKNYGGYWFNAAFFLPEEQGQSLKKELERIKDEKKLRENKLNLEFRERLDKILGSYSGAKVKY